jgi:hypothetical protein
MAAWMWSFGTRALNPSPINVIPLRSRKVGAGNFTIGRQAMYCQRPEARTGVRAGLVGRRREIARGENLTAASAVFSPLASDLAGRFT